MTKTTPVAPIPSENDQAQIVERPDGFYWQDIESGQEFGPFVTRVEAVQDMEGLNDDSIEEGESLEDAEDEIGISSWIDPDTGEPAEDVSIRHSDD
jgi:hypothetical protein